MVFDDGAPCLSGPNIFHSKNACKVGFERLQDIKHYFQTYTIDSAAHVPRARHQDQPPKTFRTSRVSLCWNTLPTPQVAGVMGDESLSSKVNSSRLCSFGRPASPWACLPPLTHSHQPGFRRCQAWRSRRGFTTGAEQGSNSRFLCRWRSRGSVPEDSSGARLQVGIVFQ